MNNPINPVVVISHTVNKDFGIFMMKVMNRVEPEPNNPVDTGVRNCSSESGLDNLVFKIQYNPDYKPHQEYAFRPQYEGHMILDRNDMETCHDTLTRIHKLMLRKFKKISGNKEATDHDVSYCGMAVAVSIIKEVLTSEYGSCQFAVVSGKLGPWLTQTEFTFINLVEAINTLAHAKHESTNIKGV